MSDILFIKQLKCEASIGCLDFEKNIKQTLLIDAEICCDCHQAAISDAIEDALNYAKIVETINQIIAAKHYQLVEHLAATLCDHLLNQYAIGSITLSLSKPQAIQNVAAVGITMTRSAP